MFSGNRDGRGVYSFQLVYSSVLNVFKSCTTVDCLCTEANIGSFGMCMNCAVGSYNYRLPVSDAQLYIDSKLSFHRSQSWGHLNVVFEVLLDRARMQDTRLYLLQFNEDPPQTSR